MTDDPPNPPPRAHRMPSEACMGRHCRDRHPWRAKSRRVEADAEQGELPK